ncbi:MAG: UDP-3-O-(3-hydroxymyristoyl)glucosamine N-acyltransferase [Candidatus Methylacidiphilales bacterium]
MSGAGIALGDLAQRLEAKLAGTAEIQITGVSDLRAAGPEHLSFLANPKYLAAARSTKAGAILIGPNIEGPFPCPTLTVDNPSVAFAQVCEWFAPAEVPEPEGIHPSAVIAPEVRLGQGVTIGPGAVLAAGVELGDRVIIGANCFIGAGSSLGAGTRLYPNVTVRERSRIGQRVILHSGAVIGSDGFGYEFIGGRHVKVPQRGYVQIDDDVEIGANTTIDRGRFDRTWIQEGVKIDNLVMIAHNVVIGAHSIIVAQTGLSGSTTTGTYVTLAGQVGTVGHIHIGDQTTITGRSAVTKDVPPKQVWRGAPAKPIRESMAIEALTQRLPELHARLQALEKAVRSLQAGV